jgi:hypothetical protein
MSDTLDKKALMAAAEESGRFYPMKGGWRNMQVFAGVLCCLLVLGIPLGVWIIIRARKAGAGVTEEGFGHRYLATVAGRWSDVESIALSSMSGAEFGGGLVGLAAASAVKARTQGLKGPILVKIRGRRFPVTIPAHTLENSVEMALEMERLSGVSFLPREQQGA